jgi:LmbE family N-acetylglucosaminyl deacetylase
MESWFLPQRKFRHLTCIPGRSALVLSPHYDDETIGCGGLLIKSVRDGVYVQVVFVASSPQPGDAESSTRMEEAESACAILGVKSVVHWCYAIRNLDTKIVAESIAKLIDESRPEILVLPWYGDNHRDHWAVNEALLLAQDKHAVGLTGLRVLAYEVWTPAPVHAIADITDVMPIKIAALREYKSQLKRWRYEEMVTALNAFRAYGKVPPHFSRVQYAEGFVYMPIMSYLELVSIQRDQLARNNS